MKRVLVVEDEDAIREFIAINLKRAGYEVAEAANGKEAVELYNACPYFEIVILDLMMPNLDGIEVCKHIRKRDNLAGIIILSAKSQEMDKINGLMMGADDYLTKPFSTSELLARVDALARRVSAVTSPSPRGTQIVSEPFVLDVTSRVLTKDHRRIGLTFVEYKMMELFMLHKGVAFTREQILTAVWSKGKIDAKGVDVNIRRLRKKIEEDPSNPRFIVTVRGTGYRWDGD